jgi:ribosome biogenesis protein ENP2
LFIILFQVRKEYKKIQREKKRQRNNEEPNEDEPKMFELKSGEEFKIKDLSKKVSKASLADRLARDTEPEVQMIGGLGNRQMVFSTEKKISKFAQRRQEELKKHREDRKKVIRPITSLKLKKTKF